LLGILVVVVETLSASCIGLCVVERLVVVNLRDCLESGVHVRSASFAFGDERLEFDVGL